MCFDGITAIMVSFVVLSSAALLFVDQTELMKEVRRGRRVCYILTVVDSYTVHRNESGLKRHKIHAAQ